MEAASSTAGNSQWEKLDSQRGGASQRPCHACLRGILDLPLGVLPLCTTVCRVLSLHVQRGIGLQIKSKDGTTKFLLRLADNHVVETVGIPLDDTNKQRLTVCVSSQVRRLFSRRSPFVSAHELACLFDAQQPQGCRSTWTLPRHLAG